jgi:hypothetical protein
MERRAIPRKPVLISGAIQFAGGAINCLVRNMTISGAALDAADPTTFPSVLTLSLRRTARTFPVTLSGAKRSGSAWPLTNPRRSRSMSQIGTLRTRRDARLESVMRMRFKADVGEMNRDEHRGLLKPG